MTNESDDHLMRCMEVWGGNRAVDGGVVLAGLDAWVYNRPYRDEDRGGDVYYLSSCASGRVTRLLVADVSGHGSAVAEMGDALRLLMRRYVNHIEQRRFMKELNERFTELSTAGGFATALVGTFFAPTRELVLSSAGHPAPLLYDRTRKSWTFLRPTRASSPGLTDVPLGIDAVATYEQASIGLNVGDLLLCYTDSLTEARDPAGRLLGSDRLLELVESCDPTDPPAMIPNVLDALERFSGGTPTDDDLTMLLVRSNGLALRAPLRDRLRTPLHLGLGLLRSLRPGGGPVPWPEMSARNIGGAMIDALNRKR